MLVSVEDLGKTNIYPEIIQKIVRGNEENAVLQIMAAESKVKSYLHKYDLLALFGCETEEPTHDDEHLKALIKTIASYYLVRKANPNINIDLFRADYEDAIDWLKDLQEGKVNPKWPYDPEATETSLGVSWTSEQKRQNSF